MVHINKDSLKLLKVMINHVSAQIILTNPTLNITIKENRQQGLTAETQDFLRWGYKHSED